MRGEFAWGFGKRLEKLCFSARKGESPNTPVDQESLVFKLKRETASRSEGERLKGRGGGKGRGEKRSSSRKKKKYQRGE